MYTIVFIDFFLVKYIFRIMDNFVCNKCNVVANSLSNSCPSCGSKFFYVNDRQRILGIATIVCIAIATGFFTFLQSVPAIAS